MQAAAPKTTKRLPANRKKPGKRPRTARSPRTRKELALIILKWGAVASVVGAALLALMVAGVFWYYGRDDALPKLNSIADYQPKQVSRIASADGVVVGEIYAERNRRSFVPFEEIPEMVVQAFVAAEDAKFFEHEGIDYMGMVRALWVNLRSGKKRQGASTITQQVVKTFLLSPERTFKRKIQEIILARRLEAKLTKEEILVLYLNQIYFGHGRYGVQEAAHYYFGKNITEVNPGEAALIAGLPQSPENISPRKPENQKRAKARQTYVLQQMVRNGFLSAEEAQKWIEAPIALVRDPYPHMGAAPEWVDLVRAELAARYGEEAVDTLGARVVTTLDLDVQRAAEEALRAGLRDIDAKLKLGRARRSVKKDKLELEVAKLAKRLPKGGPAAGERYEAVVREVHDADRELVVDLGKWKASVMLSGAAYRRFDPEGQKPSKRFSVGDVVLVQKPLMAGTHAEDTAPKHSERQVVFAPGPQGAVVVIEPGSREVRALIGGYDHRVGDFNRATMARRQPGSTFKPLVYAAAIDSGDFTAASIVNDAPEVYDLWKPENYEKGEFSGPVRLRHALAKSINTVAIRVAHDIGPERVADLARAMGIESELPRTLSLALGSGEVTPLELTNAFATLAAGGTYAPPQLVRRIDEQPVQKPERHDVLRPEVAYVVRDMMRSVVEEGTGARAQKLKMNIAGKTGTSNDARDAWFVGLGGGYVVGVWVGYDDNSPLGRRMGGSSAALPVYVQLMQKIGEPDRGALRRPANVVAVAIDKATGLLAPPGAPPESRYDEVFIEGTEPRETAPAPGEKDAASFVSDEYEDELDAAYDEDPPAPGAPAPTP